MPGLNVESERPEHLDGAGLAALEITGGKPLPDGELVGGAQDRLRRVRALLPDQVIGRGRGVAMGGEKLLRAEPVVLLQRAHHVIRGHLVPCDYVCHRIDSSSGRGPSQVSGSPPSMCSVCPVRKVLLIANRTVLATSSVVPIRRAGLRAVIST